jgi:methionyl-tRNA formyltransferase
MAGDEETGVCIMQMDEGLDTGPVRYRLTVPIEESTTGGALETSLATLGAKALLTVLSDLSLPAHAPQPQSVAGATYADKLSADDRVLDFAAPAIAIARRINALSPRLACSIESEDSLRIRCLGAAAAPEIPTEGATPGTMLCCNKEGLYLATGSGALRLHQLQVLKGKAAVLDAPAFLNGYGRHFPEGLRFASAH